MRNKGGWALARGPIIILILLAASIILSSCGSRDPYVRAEKLVGQGKYEEALEVYESILERERTERVYLALADLYEKMGDGETGLRILEEAYTSLGEDLDQIEARLEEKIQDGERLAGLYRARLENFPSSHTLVRLLEFYRQEGRHGDFKELYRSYGHLRDELVLESLMASIDQDYSSYQDLLGEIMDLEPRADYGDQFIAKVINWRAYHNDPSPLDFLAQLDQLGSKSKLVEAYMELLGSYGDIRALALAKDGGRELVYLVADGFLYVVERPGYRQISKETMSYGAGDLVNLYTGAFTGHESRDEVLYVSYTDQAILSEMIFLRLDKDRLSYLDMDHDLDYAIKFIGPRGYLDLKDLKKTYVFEYNYEELDNQSIYSNVNDIDIDFRLKQHEISYREDLGAYVLRQVMEFREMEKNSYLGYLTVYSQLGPKKPRVLEAYFKDSKGANIGAQPEYRSLEDLEADYYAKLDRELDSAVKYLSKISAGNRQDARKIIGSIPTDDKDQPWHSAADLYSNGIKVQYVPADEGWDDSHAPVLYLVIVPKSQLLTEDSLRTQGYVNRLLRNWDYKEGEYDEYYGEMGSGYFFKGDKSFSYSNGYLTY